MIYMTSLLVGYTNLPNVLSQFNCRDNAQFFSACEVACAQQWDNKKAVTVSVTVVITESFNKSYLGVLGCQGNWVEEVR
ncbi:hypothetical protein B5X24_HaOG205623 [Helicoverpa armigera]|uniref:Uncharacterized protein n=1 Tax=Helicoverpa armigera TaxID=29058 RepID=A0A2W1BVL8_HELAM|nr:hypothetical protein B5X24_HaOG205623 [Helicoverpa armigera]